MRALPKTVRLRTVNCIEKFVWSNGIYFVCLGPSLCTHLDHVWLLGTLQLYLPPTLHSNSYAQQKKQQAPNLGVITPW